MSNQANKGAKPIQIPSQSSQDPPFEMQYSSQVSAKQVKDDDIKQTKGKLDDLIEQLNGKLVDHFQKKEQKLLEEYKQELMKAQKELNQLKANTNEEQIRNKMIQRKKQLQKERHQLIEANMFFSNKCEVYKKKLSTLIQQGKQLEREVIFLQNQLQGANQKRLLLMSEIEDDSKYAEKSSNSKGEQKYQLPVFSAAKTKNMRMERGNTEVIPATERHKEQSTKARGSSLHKIAKSVSIHNPNMMKHRKNLNLLHSELPSIQGATQRVATKVFEKTLIEELFEEAVEKVRDKRRGKRTVPIIKGEQFTDYEKRLIMEEFLSSQKVKKKIYEVIFDQGPQQGKQVDDHRVKISFDDVGL